MSTQTSIGPGGDRGGNENPGNADGCGNKTLGEKASQPPPPAGADVVDEASPGELDAARGKVPQDR
jgi:hypothetical protein